MLGSTLFLALGVIALEISSPASASFDTITQLELTGYEPLAAPVVGKDGAFYGTTTFGGAMNLGTLYRAGTDGAITTLANLDTSTGYRPQGELVQGPDGTWYGTATNGGEFNYGTIFKLTPAGQLVRMYSFNGADGAYPFAGLCFGADGALYGGTEIGGTNNDGVLFKITTDGSLTVLRSFDSTVTGPFPIYPLTLAADGSLYGTTSDGGRHGFGTVFKYTAGGQFSVVVNMTKDNQYPSSPLTIGPDGNFYGTAAKGSTLGTLGGTIFKLTPNGTLTVIAGFKYPPRVSRYDSGPAGRLALAPDGNFYGVTTNSISFRAARDAELYRVTPSGKLAKMKAFWYAAGYVGPIPGVVVGTDGAVYGGFTYGSRSGGGELYRMTLDGNYSQFAEFGQCPLGCGLSSLPTVGADGALYGMTDSASLYRVTGGVYQAVAPAASRRISKPSALTRGPDGNFYGVDGYGGSNGVGSIFRITPNGHLTELAAFNSADGSVPEAAPTFGPDGALYGATWIGGTNASGVIYKLSNPTARSTASMALTILNSVSPTAGTAIVEPLTLASDGNFYGTTCWIGTNQIGIIFRMTPAGAMTTLGSTTLASSPLKPGPDGALYGLSQGGGTANAGTIFRVGLDGSVQTLFSFDGVTTGSMPNGDFVLGSDGILYGVTVAGGSGTGLVFQYDLNGQTFTVLDVYPYTANPQLNGLMQTVDGQFYTTAGSTLSWQQSAAYGAVYRWVP
jgi:uncharacterized repeat protein (TIGR03803 family)